MKAEGENLADAAAAEWVELRKLRPLGEVAEIMGWGKNVPGRLRRLGVLKCFGCRMTSLLWAHEAMEEVASPHLPSSAAPGEEPG